MIDLMQNVLLIFIEVMCCKSFFETFGAIRYKGWINFIQILLLLSSMCFYSYGFSEYFVLKRQTCFHYITLLMSKAVVCAIDLITLL